MDYIVTFEDGSAGYLSHHGIKGMKWGVWNEETKKRRSGISDWVLNKQQEHLRQMNLQNQRGHELHQQIYQQNLNTQQEHLRQVNQQFMDTMNRQNIDAMHQFMNQTHMNQVHMDVINNGFNSVHSMMF